MLYHWSYLKFPVPKIKSDLRHRFSAKITECARVSGRATKWANWLGTELKRHDWQSYHIWHAKLVCEVDAWWQPVYYMPRCTLCLCSINVMNALTRYFTHRHIHVHVWITLSDWLAMGYQFNSLWIIVVDNCLCGNGLIVYMIKLWSIYLIIQIINACLQNFLIHLELDLTNF